MGTETPLHAADHWLGGPGSVPVSVMLLRDDVLTLPETATLSSDLTSYEIANGGNYTSGTGVAMPDLTAAYDTTAGIFELGYTTATVTSTPTNLTVAGVGWVVWIDAATTTGAAIISAVKLDASTSIDAGPLHVQLQESAYIAGSYPIFRLTRVPVSGS